MDESGLPKKRDEPNSLTRTDLERVVRRAVELYASEREEDERLSPAEALQIATELGLPERHVRQAMRELEYRPQLPEGTRSRAVDRTFGSGWVAATRVVDGDPADTLARLEDYLVAREYLQVRRKQPGVLYLQPADDTLSAVSRALGSLSRKFYLRRADRVVVSAQALESARTHLRIELDCEAKRTGAAKGGAWTGGVMGGIVGAGVFMPIAAGLTMVAEAAPIGIAVGAAAALLSAGSGAMLGFRTAGKQFRQQCEDLKAEVEAVLDRLESRGALEPPAPPWMRRLRSR